MAANNSTTDGLGFEEVNQASSTELISGTNIYGTNGSFVDIRANSIQNADGYIYSNILGSATTLEYSGYTQAGSFSTSAGSQGFLKLAIPFSTTNWYAVVTPCGSATGVEESYISGLKHISGVNFVGAASLRYDFIAIGP